MLFTYITIVGMLVSSTVWDDCCALLECWVCAERTPATLTEGFQELRVRHILVGTNMTRLLFD